MDGIIWLIIFVVLILIEVVTLGLTTIWFAGGALVAFISSLLGLGTLGQIILFLIVSFAMLIITRPIAVKYFNKGRTKTNVESLIGETAIVLEDINNLQATGRAQIRGQEWMARTADDSTIAKGKEVEVVEIQGVKLIVKEK